MVDRPASLRERNGACNQVWRRVGPTLALVRPFQTGSASDLRTISSAPAGADIQVVGLSQRQKVRRRLGGSIPEQNVRRLSANSGENQKMIYSRTEFWLAAQRSIAAGSVGR
jgi:hypothetical protein